jgi:hypothetical protein
MALSVFFLKTKCATGPKVIRDLSYALHDQMSCWVVTFVLLRCILDISVSFLYPKAGSAWSIYISLFLSIARHIPISRHHTNTPPFKRILYVLFQLFITPVTKKKH